MIVFSASLLILTFTSCHPTVRDIDGNKYRTVKIGDQIWMAEDLKTTHFNDGTPITVVTDYDSWSKLSTPARTWYNNDSAARNDDAMLYNFYVVASDKLCPKGWHVPSDVEWMALGTYLGGPQVAGGKLKEKGTAHWKSPNIEASNQSGFTALPGGFRSFNGSFNLVGKSGYWWSSTEYTKTTVFFFSMRYKYTDLYKYISDKTNGFCVRCLMDKSK